MTTSRIVRGTKARIFLYISASLIIIALIACYNNTLTQLEDIRKSNEICHQQDENLSIQLQVITDYKQRLEKSLKTEKAEHQQTKNDLENKLNDEHMKNEKNSNDLNLRFTSLQQHFNILQTQHDDVKEECSKTQNKQLNEINDLQAKLKEIQEELKKVDSTKESLKTQYLQIQSEKEQLERQLKTNLNTNNDSESRMNHLTKINHELQEELDQLKMKCPGFGSLQRPNQSSSSLPPHNVASLLSSKKSDTKKALASPKVSNVITNTTRSTKAASKYGSLNNVLPLGIPSVSPKSAKKNQMTNDNVQQPPPPPMLNNNNGNNDNNNKRIPEGVVPAPVVDNPANSANNNNKENEEKNIDVDNELMNNRYRNQIDSEVKLDNENNNNNSNDNDNNNNNDKRNDDVGVIIDENAAQEIGENIMHRQHIDPLADNNNNNNNNNVYQDHQLENEDDEDDYGDHQDRQKDAVVRN